jgi:hypothetical protein
MFAFDANSGHSHSLQLPSPSFLSRSYSHSKASIQYHIEDPAMTEVKDKVCLIVHDGWGIATEPGLEGNAIEAGSTENMDTIGSEHSQRKLAAHGTAVGLSDGLMGNSEVGCVFYALLLQ